MRIAAEREVMRSKEEGREVMRATASGRARMRISRRGVCRSAEEGEGNRGGEKVVVLRITSEGEG